jgi:hypothetical protein
VSLGKFLADIQEFCGDHHQPATFQSFDDFTNQPALDSVWFDEHEGSFHDFSPFQKMISRNLISRSDFTMPGCRYLSHRLHFFSLNW